MPPEGSHNSTELKGKLCLQVALFEGMPPQGSHKKNINNYVKAHLAFLIGSCGSLQNMPYNEPFSFDPQNFHFQS